jgi:cysteine desulfurase family protein (TIGR01976 family)
MLLGYDAGDLTWRQTMTAWNETAVRAAFPALALTDEGQPRVYVDAPGGTQVCERTLTRMREALVDHCANEGGAFRTSAATDEWLQRAHVAGGQFMNAAADEVIYGLNTTSLVFHMSRMIARSWRPGDNILVTRMDHDSNVAPWLIAAAERDVEVRFLDFDPATWQYRYDTLDTLVDARTRLIACNHASNFLGTINDVRRIVSAGRAVGAVTVVDAVQSAPHLALDARAIGSDIVSTSPYKYFGPHAGLMYLRREFADSLQPPLKVRPSLQSMPHRHAPGTPSFEAQLGTLGALEHLAWLGTAFGGADVAGSLREQMAAGLSAATVHETQLSAQFLRGVQALSKVRVHGLSDPAAVQGRVPTFSFTVEGMEPEAVARRFAARNQFVWYGSFYAMEVAQRLGLWESGVVRLGLAHYNTAAEVDALLETLESCCV